MAFRPGTGQSVIDWNKELIAIISTPRVQPPTIHPTRSFAMLQAAEYDAVVSITHADRPYLLS
ncbi:MAG TPA: haloperoxidase, partial [Actinomycetota bacterium]|nr:haloperoxidase [Actinomycetota bacterium]